MVLKTISPGRGVRAFPMLFLACNCATKAYPVGLIAVSGGR